MKQMILLFVLIALTGGLLSALDGIVAVGVSTLFQGKSDAAEKKYDNDLPLHPLVFASVFAGFGGHWKIIPGLLAPGIYGDLHIGLLSLLFAGLLSEEDYEAKTNLPLIFQTGIRAYNEFSLGPFYLQPFAGLNLLGILAGNSVARGYGVFGVLLGFNNFGVEYSFQTPLRRKNNANRNIHRIALLFTVDL